MAVKFRFSDPFSEVRSKIEDHLFNSIMDLENDQEKAIKSIDNFSQGLYDLCDLLEQMYTTQKPNDIIGEKSFPIINGKYRVYYKMTIDSATDLTINFLDIDDNRQSNIDRFPTHSVITFDSE